MGLYVSSPNSDKTITNSDKNLSKCPVNHKSFTEQSALNKSSSSHGCPVNNSYKNQSIYNVYGEVINPDNQMPINPNQLPAVGQKMKLPTERLKSSILKGGTDGDTWTYPSPQMFYNATLLRNKDNSEVEVQPETMELEVQIHNNLNEHTWKEVMKWEQLRFREGCSVTLLKFYGRSLEYSPIARIRSWLGKDLPFDRHDWIIDRCGKEIRYVIDYYHDESIGEENKSRYLVHVRPALDSFSSFWDRTRACIGRMFNVGEPVGGYTTPGPLKFQSQSSMKFESSMLEQISEEEFQFLSLLDVKKIEEINENCKKNCGKLINILNENKENYKAEIALNCCIGKVVCPKIAEQLSEKLTNINSTEEEVSNAYQLLSGCLWRYTNQAQKVVQNYSTKKNEDL